MVKPQSPVTVDLEPTEATVVLGCPGVPRSVPRIETKLQIRSVDGRPFTLRSVGVELRTVQRVSVPSTIGSNDAEHEYRVYHDPNLFSPSFGNFTEHLLGLDIPVLIYLPRDLTSSGHNTNWNASTIHHLYVKLALGESAESELNFVETFPIAVKLYDALPIYRQFTESINEMVVSQDQQLVAEYHLKESCIGPNDHLNLLLKVSANPHNYKTSKKLKIKTLAAQVKEILECHESGLPPYKDIKIHEDIIDCKDMNLTAAGLDFKLNVQLPFNNDFLSTFDHSDLVAEKYKYFDDATDLPTTINNKGTIKQNSFSLIEGIPVTHYQKFTVLGKLFSIRYEIVLKFKVIHGKDFDVTIPIVISPYNKESSQYLLEWIIKQCKIATKKFGKNVVDQLQTTFNYNEINHILKGFRQPPRLYRYTKQDWVKLGFSVDAFGATSNLTSYID